MGGGRNGKITITIGLTITITISALSDAYWSLLFLAARVARQKAGSCRFGCGEGRRAEPAPTVRGSRPCLSDGAFFAGFLAVVWCNFGLLFELVVASIAT